MLFVTSEKLFGPELDVKMVSQKEKRVNTYAKKRVQTAVVHKFGDDHDGIRFGDHTLQVDHIRMIKLSHNRSLGQKIHTGFITSTRF